MSDVGYASIELGEVELSFKHDPVGEEDELSLRVDLLIEDESNMFRWQSNGEAIISSENLKPFKKPKDLSLTTDNDAPDDEQAHTQEGDESCAPKQDDNEDAMTENITPNTVYTLGIANFFKRTQFIDLNNENLAAFANTKVVIKISQSRAEGDEPTEAFCTLSIPLSHVLMAGTGSITRTTYLSEEIAVIGTESLVSSESFVSWTLLLDNDMAEFCLGCSILNWKSATISAPSIPWTLMYEDVIDPKAKVAPTDEELRSAYIEGVGKLVESQRNLVKYTLSVGVAPSHHTGAIEEAGTKEEATESTRIVQEETPEPALLPCIVLGEGNIMFNTELATAVDVSENIRKKTELWNLTFGASPTLFLHRNQVRDLALRLNSNSILPVTLKKSPTEEGASTQGENELVATGTVDLAPLLAPGSTECSLTVNDLAGSGFGEKHEACAPGENSPLDEEKQEQDEEAKNDKVSVPVTQPAVNLSFSASTALVPRPTKVTSANAESILVSGRTVSVSQQRDVLKELKEEISACIKTIAVEYISKYPINEGSEGSDDVNVKSIDDKKVEFLHYLSSSGVYHTLKESLKPKIQRVVRAEFGVRGQAIQKKPSFDISSSSVNEEKVNGISGQLLADLYVYLVKVCNQVLNNLYTSTVIDKDTADVDKGGVVDDEDESAMQRLTRLANQAVDNEADGRILESEQRLLERIQIVKNDKDLASNPSVNHECYHRLAELNLRQLANTMIAATSAGVDTDLSSASCNSYTSRAREALSTCVELVPEEWQARQQLACLMDEAGLFRQAEEMLVAVVQDQVSRISATKGGLKSFDDEFDGYDSDMICPVQPMTYAILAAHFSKTGMPLKARKCLRLANKSYMEASIEPTVEKHGSPRRTVVFDSLASRHVAHFLRIHQTRY